MDTRVPGYRDFKNTVQGYYITGIKNAWILDTMTEGYRDTVIQ